MNIFQDGLFEHKDRKSSTNVVKQKNGEKNDRDLVKEMINQEARLPNFQRSSLYFLTPVISQLRAKRRPTVVRTWCALEECRRLLLRLSPVFM